MSIGLKLNLILRIKLLLHKIKWRLHEMLRIKILIYLIRNKYDWNFKDGLNNKFSNEKLRSPNELYSNRKIKF
jgi:hypothetical protein